MKKKIALMLAFGCISVNAASVNYDLLGRRGSKMNSPMVYRNVDYDKVKKNEPQIGSSLENKALGKVGLKSNVTAIAGIYNPQNSKTYYLKKYYADNSAGGNWYSTIDQYMNQSNSAFIPVTYNTGDPASFGNETGTRTHTDVSGYSVNYQSYTYNNGEHIQTSPYEGNKQIAYVPFDYIRYRSYWIDGMRWLYQAPYDGESSNVGVYMASEARPVKMAENDVVSYIRYSPVSAFKTMPGHEMIAAKSYKLLKKASNRSVVYVGTGSPENPADKNPQIYMGLHNAKCVSGNSSATNKYDNDARKLDNYIYNYRTTEIVAAGNFGTKPSNGNPWTGYLAAKAHAANAITVGAAYFNEDFQPYMTKNITNYTSYVTPVHGSRKPEVYNYSHILMNDDPKIIYTTGSKTHEFNPFYDGTEMAAAYTAGMVSDLLNANSFYRWHPEVVKAVMLTGGYDQVDLPYPHDAPMAMLPSYSSTVFSQFHNNFGHHSRYWIGSMDRLKTSPLNTALSSDAIAEIRFTVKTSDYFNLKTTSFPTAPLKAAIAWLNSGDDIAGIGRIPQDFDLFVFGNNTENVDRVFPLRDWLGNTLNNNIGGSYKNMSFTLPRKYEYLTFSIVFWKDETSLPNKNQIVLGFDLSR